MPINSLWNALSDLNSPQPETVAAALDNLRSYGADAVAPLGLALRIGDVNARQAAVRALALFPGLPAVTYLIEAVHDGDTGARDAAVEALAQIGSPAVEPLLNALRDTEEYATDGKALRSLNEPQITAPVLERLAARQGNVRRALMETLARIGDLRGVETFTLALRDADGSIRLLAAEALARSGPDQIPALLAALDEDLTFRQRVAESLAANGNTFDERAMSTLHLASRVGRAPVRWVADYVLSRVDSLMGEHSLDHALSDPDADVRLIAIQSARAVTDSNIDALLKATRDTNALARRAAVKILGESNDPRALATLVQAVNDEDAEVRSLALRTVSGMAEIGDLDPLINALNSRDTALRKMAMDTLSGMEAERVVLPLLDALDQDAYGDVARTLGRSGDVRAVEPLLNTLSGATYVSRQAAIEALGMLGDKRALPAFLNALNDDTASVREAAVKALDKLAAPEAIGRLVEALSDSAPAVREGASLALEHMGPLVLQAMLPSLESPDWRVRLNAVQILGRIGDVRAVEVLIRKLHDPAGNVCGAVITELKKLADARCIGWLLRGLEDRDAYVRENVADLLMQLGDSYTLPRLILAESRLPERDRAAILDYMRSIRYSDRHITFRFTAIGDVVSFCRQMSHDPDIAVQAGAKALLAFIERLRATQQQQKPE
jgi:HEAT repeat protein